MTPEDVARRNRLEQSARKAEGAAITIGCLFLFSMGASFAMDSAPGAALGLVALVVVALYALGGRK